MAGVGCGEHQGDGASVVREFSEIFSGWSIAWLLDHARPFLIPIQTHTVPSEEPGLASILTTSVTITEKEGFDPRSLMR
jgi:hypothetical protein